jgi:predicted DCC family thiol-disulfide oxidoreductase YuxK
MTPDPSGQPLRVFYDGACPLCRREIALYQRLAAGAPVAFVDVSQAEDGWPHVLTRAQLLARLHVQQPDGSICSGAAAFVALWAVLPGWRGLAWLARLPGVLMLMERGYRGFLRWRPLLQRCVRRRVEMSSCAPGRVCADSAKVRR